MGILGTNAGIESDILILGEIVLTVLVYLGVRSIKRDRLGHVGSHRRIMLSVLIFNVVLLLFFVVMDLIKASNTVERGLEAPLWVFIPLLIVHLAIAITAVTLAVRAWLIARKGTVRDGQGQVVNVTPEVRAKHRAISRYYPPMWYATLVTGLILYGMLYVVY